MSQEIHQRKIARNCQTSGLVVDRALKPGPGRALDVRPKPGPGTGPEKSLNFPWEMIKISNF